MGKEQSKLSGNGGGDELDLSHQSLSAIPASDHLPSHAIAVTTTINLSKNELTSISELKV
jgi:hypothetical protein